VNRWRHLKQLRRHGRGRKGEEQSPVMKGRKGIVLVGKRKVGKERGGGETLNLPPYRKNRLRGRKAQAAGEKDG